MITVGLINELRYISKALRTPVNCTLKCDRFKSELQIQIKEQVLELWYLGYFIWRENLDGPESNFGVESCDHITKIMILIDTTNGNEWQQLRYIEK